MEATPFLPGEEITWDVKYLGLTSGTAWARVEEGEDGLLVFEGGARSSPWYERIYLLDDWIRTTWDPGGPGSVRYESRFREGSFHQDQEMSFSSTGIDVTRRQRFQEGWREWSDSFDGPGHPVEDPQSAFYRVRTLDLPVGARHGFKVFSGRQLWRMEVHVMERETLSTAIGPVAVVVVELLSFHAGDDSQRGRFTLYLSDDHRRVPVRCVVHSRKGPIRADVSSYSPGSAELGER